MTKYHIGPQKWPKVIRRLLSVRELNNAGRIHDLMYSKNTKVSKKQADRIFKQIMLVAIKEHPSFGKRLWLRVLAEIYYIMVVGFGTITGAYKGNIR